MLVRQLVSNGVWLEEEVSTEAEAFKMLSRMREVFHHPKCGKCGCTDVAYVCRKDSDDNDWLEVVCQNHNCRAKLIFGQTKKGGQIYPKTRWDNLSEKQQEQREDEKEYAEAHRGFLPNGGWFQYKGQPVS